MQGLAYTSYTWAEPESQFPVKNLGQMVHYVQLYTQNAILAYPISGLAKSAEAHI